MKRFVLGASSVLALVLPAVAQAVPLGPGDPKPPPLNAPTAQDARAYLQAYNAVARKFGSRTPGRNIVYWGFDPGRASTDSEVVASTALLQRMLIPPPAAPSVPAATTSTPYGASGASSGGLANVPGVPAAFAACVAMRESTDGQGSSNIYGILGGGGSGSLAQQKAAFSQMYAQSGAQPWSPYDGC